MFKACRVKFQTWMSAWAVLLVLQVPGCWCEPVEPEKFNTFPDGLPGGANDYCGAWAQAACQRAQRCEPAVYAGFNSLGGCVVRMEERCRRDRAPQLAAEGVKRVQYDNRHALGCVTQEAGRSCNDAPSPSCAQVFVGIVPANQPCVEDLECASGLFCSGGPLSCGMCTARSALGGPCWGASSCQAGLSCKEGYCQQPLGAGASCAEDANACGNGTFCFPVIPGIGPLPISTCASAAGEGVSCGGQLPLPCQTGLSCLRTDGGAFCRAAVPEGQPCDPQAITTPPCQDVGRRLYCDPATRLCAPATVVGQGDACGQSALCEAHLRCVSNRCETRPRAGEDCAVDATGANPCFESTCTNGTCVAPAAVGDGCDAGCPGLSCVRNTCGKDVCDGGEAFDAWVPTPDASVEGVMP